MSVRQINRLLSKSILHSSFVTPSSDSSTPWGFKYRYLHPLSISSGTSSISIQFLQWENNLMFLYWRRWSNYSYDIRLLLMPSIPFCAWKYWQNQFANMLPIYCLRIGCIQVGNSMLDYVCHVFLCTSEFIKMPLQSIFSNF